MAVKLENKVSGSDREKLKEARRKPEYEEGLEPDAGAASSFFDSQFEDSDSSFFGDDCNSGSSFDGGSFNSFDNGAVNFGNINGGFNNQQAEQKQPPKETVSDVVQKATVDFTKYAGEHGKNFFTEFREALKNKTGDDWSNFASTITRAGGTIAVGGFIVSLLGQLSGHKWLGFMGMPSHFVVSGLLSCGLGIGTIGIMSWKIAKLYDCGDISSLPDVGAASRDRRMEYESKLNDMFNNLYGKGGDFSASNSKYDDYNDYNDEEDNSSDYDNYDDYEDYNNESESSDDDWKALIGAWGGNESSEDEDNNKDKKDDEIDSEEVLDSVREGQISDRSELLRIFKRVMQTLSPDFNKRVEIEQDSDTFQSLDVLSTKAVAWAVNKNIDELETGLVRAYENQFCYELYYERVRGLNKLDKLQEEIENHFREDSDDKSVKATVNIEGSEYKIVVTKGVKSIVTIGDCLEQKDVYEFFEDEDNELPVILGIDEVGKVLLGDARRFDAAIIAGKPRAGKSWYVDTQLLCMMGCNTPMDVSFIIIDPKRTNIFKTISLMPHVIGFHDETDTLDVLEEVVRVEASKREELLFKNKCDSIGALREKGINVPILYIVMDEYLTIVKHYDRLDKKKELSDLMLEIITRLPYVGIRIMMIPHRTVGLLDKTTRAMVQMSVNICGNLSEIKDTLDVPKWERTLFNKGDGAVKTTDMPEPKYIRGAAPARNDESVAKEFETLARSFYKMGVEVYDFSDLKLTYNIDRENTRKYLLGETDMIQFNTSRTQKSEDSVNTEESIIFNKNGERNNTSSNSSKSSVKRDEYSYLDGTFPSYE